MIRIEEWNGHKIRFIYDDGEWKAVAKDVSKVLDYSDSNRMTRLLDKEELTVIEKSTNPTLWGSLGDDYKRQSKVVLIAETGIYEAIINSRKPEAKEFKKWVKQLIKALRQQIGLEGFAVFKMLDKEHQKKAMEKLSEVAVDKKDYIKANSITNKALSNKYGFQKTVKKDEMTPEMLKDRQPILDEVVELMKFQKKYNMDFSVSQVIYSKYNDESLNENN